MKDLEDDCDSSSKEVVELFQDAYELARIRYEQGRYQDALDLLIELDYFVEDYPLWIPTTWGKLCCEILLEKWNKVRDTAKRLKFKIDDYVIICVNFSDLPVFRKHCHKNSHCSAPVCSSFSRLARSRIWKSS